MVSISEGNGLLIDTSRGNWMHKRHQDSFMDLKSLENEAMKIVEQPELNFKGATTGTQDHGITRVWAQDFRR